jgi:hypothetical protein
MYDSICRRQLLRSGFTGFSLILTGCSGVNPFGCADHEAVVVRINPVNSTPEDPIHLRELSDEQQSLLRQAIEDGVYRRCPHANVDNQSALANLADSIGEHQIATESESVYLEDSEDYYVIDMFRIEDQVIA